MFTALMSLFTGGVGAYKEIRGAQIKAKAADIQQQGQIQLARVNDMSASWKDEAWTIFFIGTLVLMAFPPLQPYFDQWFRYVEQLPDWYQHGFYASIAASFGLGTGRTIANHVRRRRQTDAQAEIERAKSPPAVPMTGEPPA